MAGGCGWNRPPHPHLRAVWLQGPEGRSWPVTVESSGFRGWDVLRKVGRKSELGQVSSDPGEDAKGRERLQRWGGVDRVGVREKGPHAPSESL